MCLYLSDHVQFMFILILCRVLFNISDKTDKGTRKEDVVETNFAYIEMDEK